MVILTLTALIIAIVVVTLIIVGRPRFIHVAGSTRLVVGMPQLGRKPRNTHLAHCQKSIHWRDGKFRNEHPAPIMTKNKSKYKLIREFLFTRHHNIIPHHKLPAVKTDLATLPLDKDLIIWFGHSSYFIQMGGKRILVDPVFHSAAPVNFICRPFKGTDIYKPTDIPDIDLMIITHNHYDHLDYETVRNIKPKVKRVVCPLGVGASLVFWGYPVYKILEMDWWKEASLAQDLTVCCTPARHFSGRTINDSNETLWASFVLASADKKVYIGGDSGYDTHFKQIGEKYGPFDVAFLENGQYNIDWKHIHTLPEEMLAECKEINARRIFSVHHGKFCLAYHTWDEPLQNIDTLKAAGIDVLPDKIGEVVEF